MAGLLASAEPLLAKRGAALPAGQLEATRLRDANQARRAHACDCLWPAGAACFAVSYDGTPVAGLQQWVAVLLVPRSGSATCRDLSGGPVYVVFSFLKHEQELVVAPLTPGRRELQGLRHLRQGRRAQAEPSKAVVRSVEWHPDGQVLLTAGLDKRLRFFQARSSGLNGCARACLSWAGWLTVGSEKDLGMSVSHDIAEYRKRQSGLPVYYGVTDRSTNSIMQVARRYRQRCECNVICCRGRWTACATRRCRVFSLMTCPSTRRPLRRAAVMCASLLAGTAAVPCLLRRA